MQQHRLRAGEETLMLEDTIDVLRQLAYIRQLRAKLNRLAELQTGATKITLAEHRIIFDLLHEIDRLFVGLPQDSELFTWPCENGQNTN